MNNSYKPIVAKPRDESRKGGPDLSVPHYEKAAGAGVCGGGAAFGAGPGGLRQHRYPIK